jgi:glyoxylase-like metal-dependent hydrolase (beta-lactamase superfamily II)
MIFRQLFDRTSCTYTYLLGCERTAKAVLIDPVIELVDRDLELIGELGLTLAASVDTHVHADHVTAASMLEDRTGCEVVYPASAELEVRCRTLAHDAVLEVGDVRLRCLHTPGHTAGSACYLQEEAGRVFTGDTLLIRGCGRTDFQGGSARTLYRSIHGHLFRLPDTTQVWPGHDYKGRTVSTIGEEKAHNPRLKTGIDEDAFVTIMENLGLAYPKMIDVAVPANRRLGEQP